MENLIFKEAKIENLPDIISLLFDDELGITRENPTAPLHNKYVRENRI